MIQKLAIVSLFSGFWYCSTTLGHFEAFLRPDVRADLPNGAGGMKVEVKMCSYQQSRPGAHVYWPSYGDLNFLMPVEWIDLGV